MNRRIASFHQDDEGDWVATLECRHRQHVRHQPPFRDRSWVLDEAQRTARIGSLLECPLCDRAELPADLSPVRTTDTWTATTFPRAVRRDHRIASATWGLLRVHAGHVRFEAETSPAIDRVLGPGAEQPIPPDVTHHVEPLDDDVECAVTFLR